MNLIAMKFWKIDWEQKLKRVCCLNEQDCLREIDARVFPTFCFQKKWRGAIMQVKDNNSFYLFQYFSELEFQPLASLSIPLISIPSYFGKRIHILINLKICRKPVDTHCCISL